MAETEEWVQKANLPASGRHGPIGFSIGNKGYVGMGHINSGPQGDVSFNDLWEYDTATNSWTQKADYPGTPFHYGTSFSYQNEGYIGYDFEFYKFSPVTNSYSQLQSPAIPLHWNKSIPYNDIIVLLDYTNMYLYNPVIDSWSILSDFSGFKKEVILERNNKMYALGYYNYNKWMVSVWDEANQFWDTLSFFPDSIHKSHLCGFELNGDFYFSMGAESDFGTGKSNWKYDFDQGTWEQLKDFKGAGRRYYSTFEVENKGYIFGGTNGINMNNLWQFVPEDTCSGHIIVNPPPITFYNDLPYPNPSTNDMYFDVGDNTDELLHTVYLFNLQGEIIQTESTIEHKIILHKNGLAAGIYYYVMTVDGQRLRTGSVQFQ